MEKVLDREEIIERLESKEVMDFANKYNITTMIIFGSIISNEFNVESDVDIAILSHDEIELDNILDIELFLQNLLNREIDVLDLRSEGLDLFLKINILNKGKVLYTKDNRESLDVLYNETDKTYKENENFIHFRKVDVLS
ncbi:type VII toxin-antitoxin system MntA family adenylyltransferase antitoxin [Clostridium grantii]|uniref:Predicted nucleotidyltransferase n=1 Tax=Clostridium grantii DSM 8605 TaxID=1121316 RepID=A0A1M5S3A7_9CLOT|nr:nucleotidyltransferase domain-containing protein [Clostridium grantii]SHH33087.1 Predicted nucleotidyltransferase [Clostridium grantii DSM 8605]